MEVVALGGVPLSTDNDGQYRGGVSVGLIHKESSSVLVLDAGLMKEPVEFRKNQRISIIRRPDENLPATKFPFSVNDLLPNWSLLDEYKNIYILITHAHADHAAGLPFLYKRMKLKGKHVKVIMKPESYRLLKILLLDMLKIFEAREEKSAAATVNEFLFHHRKKDFIFLNMLAPTHLGQFSIEAYNSGHILGAVSYLITGPDKKRVIFTGDISFSNQSLLYPSRIVDGSGNLANSPIDLLITEATSATRDFPSNFTEEEKKFIEEVNKIRNQGGWVIIPALAIGRVSEILNILNRNGIRPFLEGELAKESVKAYQKSGYNIRYNEFEYYGAREKIGPLVVVAPSGMLNGGWSLWWAKKIINDSKSAILITSWQDPVGVGTFLLNSQKEEKVLFYDLRKEKWEEKIIRAEIKQFSFSTHPCLNSLKNMGNAKSTKSTMLIHADRNSLIVAASAIKNSFVPEIGKKYIL